MSKLDRWDKLSLVVSTGVFAVIAAVYRRLPARMPVHFDLHGHVDGYLPRSLAIAIMPVGMLSTWALLRIGPRFFARPLRARMDASPTSVVAFWIVALFTALQLVMIRVALSPEVDIGPALGIILGVSWIALGLAMPRLRRNPFMGVRVRWTLASDENWARTHRVAGIAMTIGGVVATLLAIGGAVAPSIGVVLATMLVPLVYSYVLSRRRPRYT